MRARSSQLVLTTATEGQLGALLVGKREGARGSDALWMKRRAAGQRGGKGNAARVALTLKQDPILMPDSASEALLCPVAHYPASAEVRLLACDFTRKRLKFLRATPRNSVIACSSVRR